MSYFSSEKKSLISMSALVSSATQTITTSLTAVTVFNNTSITQLASSVKYPSISASSDTILLESGWKYIIEPRFKANNVGADTSTYLRYYITSSGSTISSIGMMPIYRDLASQASYSQEKCVAYIDAISSSQSISIMAQRVGGSANIGINGDAGGINTNARSYILIKAWR